MILKQILWFNWGGGGGGGGGSWLVICTYQEAFLAEPAEDCPVGSLLLFVDILLVSNTDK